MGSLGGHWDEGGFDMFSITSTPQTAVNEFEQENSKLIKIVDMLEEKRFQVKTPPLFYIYENGKVEKKILIK